MPYIHVFDESYYDDENDVAASKPGMFSYEKPELGDANGSAPLSGTPNPGIKVPSYLKLDDHDKDVLTAFLPAMKDAGVRRCHLSYDGGSDEGFGTLERCEDADGNDMTIETLLANTAFIERLTHFVMPAFDDNRHPVMRRSPPDAPKLIEDYLAFELPVILVSLLVGRGYGTGEYELYGRAVADLDTMTITDYPDAPFPNGPSN